MASDPERMTIDELAHRSGTAASTIRLYQTKGVLPPPAKSGRVGFYGPGHLARLRLISELQEKGFSLAGIGRLVDAWESGRGLGDVLGLEAQIAATWGTEEPVRLRPDEFGSLFPGGEFSAELVQRTLALGLVTIDGDHVVVNSPRLLEIGTELVRLGIPVEHVIDEYERLQEMTTTVAERFTELFELHLWGPFVERGLAADGGRELTEVLRRLSTLAEGVVTVTLRQSLERAATAFLAEQAQQLQQAGVPDDLK